VWPRSALRASAGHAGLVVDQHGVGGVRRFALASHHALDHGKTVAGHRTVMPRASCEVAVAQSAVGGGGSVMTTTPEFLPIPTIDERWRVDPLRLAVAGYLARYRGETRRHA